MSPSKGDHLSIKDSPGLTKASLDLPVVLLKEEPAHLAGCWVSVDQPGGP